MLSVILPSYNEEKMIFTAADTISGILSRENIDFELLFVDDGSKDATWENITKAAQMNSHVVGIHFSRNFGKEAAMFAGLEKAAGDCCVVLDCDLQHPPEKIVEMYRLWEEGYEVVEGIKEDRGEESGFHKFAANSFYGLISRATGMDMSSSSDFKLLDRKVVDTLNSLPERNVFFRALSFWVGYKKATVYYSVRERTEGESKWSTKSLIKCATLITCYILILSHNGVLQKNLSHQGAVILCLFWGMNPIFIAVFSREKLSEYFIIFSRHIQIHVVIPRNKSMMSYRSQTASTAQKHL